MAHVTLCHFSLSDLLGPKGSVIIQAVFWEPHPEPTRPDACRHRPPPSLERRTPMGFFV
jgi:hypothetical protein